jgi:hypothetical protein
MKIRFTVFALLFFVITAIAQSSKENKVWERVDLLNKTVFGTKDSVVLARLVGNNLTYGHSGGNIEDKTRMVHNASVSPTVYKNISTEKIGINFIKKTAIVRYIFRATSVEKGVETPLNLGMLQVWAKESGEWKLQARQAVKVNPK